DDAEKERKFSVVLFTEYAREQHIDHEVAAAYNALIDERPRCPFEKLFAFHGMPPPGLVHQRTWFMPQPSGRETAGMISCWRLLPLIHLPPRWTLSSARRASDATPARRRCHLSP